MSKAVSVRLSVGEFARAVRGSGSVSARGWCSARLVRTVICAGMSPWGVFVHFGWCWTFFLDPGEVPEVQKQTVRQQARAQARQARAKVRQAQARQARRLAKWGEQVAVALAERDAVVTACEQRAGRALRALVEEEGLSTQEALAWCGDDTLTGREVYRLIRGVTNEDEADDSGEYRAKGSGKEAPVSMVTAKTMPR